MTEVKIQPGTISKVVMWYSTDATFVGFELFDSKRTLLYKPTIGCYNHFNYKSKSYDLNLNERIVGIISRLNP